MPKGVEHADLDDRGDPLSVKESVMPKGVEHYEY